jgi:hypothetical protein
MMKKLSLLCLMLLLTLSVIIACESGTDGSADTTVGITDPVTEGLTVAVTTEGSTEAETEPPVTLEGENGDILTGDSVYGWFDYGSALYMRDNFKVGAKDSLAFTCGKAGEKMGKTVILFVISLISGVITVFVVISRSEIVDPAVDLRSEFLRGRKNDQGKRSDGVACLLEFVV